MTASSIGFPIELNKSIDAGSLRNHAGELEAGGQTGALRRVFDEDKTGGPENSFFRGELGAD